MAIHLSSVCIETPYGQTLLENVNLSLGARQKYGLVGPNGVGKSTLVRLLAGEVEPAYGSVQVRAHLHVLPQQEMRYGGSVESFTKDLFQSARSFDGEGLVELAESLVGGIDLSAGCGDLSGGQWARLRMAKLIAKTAQARSLTADDGRPVFLVFDEPTNDLDREGRQAFKAFLSKVDCGVLVVSHDRDLLEEMDTIFEFANGRVHVFGGAWSKYESARTAERERLEDKVRHTKKSLQSSEQVRIRKIQDQGKRVRSGKRSAIRRGESKEIMGFMKRNAEKTSAVVDTKSRQKVESELEMAQAALREIKVDPTLYAEFPSTRIPGSKSVVHLEDFNFRYEGESKFLWFRPITLHVVGAARISFEGNNGAGKSTLLKIIEGHEPPKGEATGRVERGRLCVKRLDQGLSSLDMEASVLGSAMETTGLDSATLRNELAKYLFTKDKVHQSVATLSGGEKLKLALAQILLADPAPQLLILDEPTNNVDLATQAFLESALNAYEGALIVVSHDRVFLDRLGIDRTLDLNEHV